MKLLFVGDRLPIPPQSGWEVPIARLIERLRGQHEITYLVSPPRNELQAEEWQRIEAARSLFTNVHVIPSRPQSGTRAALEELLLRRPMYMAHDIDVEALREALGDTPFDAVWVALAGMAGFPAAYRAAFPQYRPRFMLGLNDATHWYYVGNGLEFVRGSIERDLASLLRLLRAPVIALHERSYLRDFDVVHVQTRREARRLERILPRGSRPGLVVAPNGVDEALLELPYDASHATDVVMVSHLRDGREKQALWFVREVWSRVQREYPDVHLHIYGQPGRPELVRHVESFGNVHAHGFARELRDVFAGRAISVVPVQQTSGLVTKVVDSMAAGVPVVGLQALHTLDGYEDGVHGIAVRTGEQLADAITSLLADPARRTTMSKVARQFVREAFGWNRTLGLLTDSLLAVRPASANATS